MSKERFFRMVGLGIKKFRDPYYHGFAAQLAFYYILSIVPIFLLLSQLLLYIFHTDISSALNWMLENTSSSLARIVKSLMTYKSAGAVNIIYILIAMWAASRAQFALARITNFTYTDGRTTGRGFWAERIRSVFTMFIVILAIFLALVVLIYGNQVIHFVFGDVAWWKWLRWPVVFVLYFFLLLFMYYMLPTTRWKFRQLLPGTIFSSIGLLVITWLYGLYVDTVVNYDIIYGALANIVAIMFWFFFFSWVICLGVLTNKLWWDTKDMTSGESFNYSEYVDSMEEVE